MHKDVKATLEIVKSLEESGKKQLELSNFQAYLMQIYGLNVDKAIRPRINYLFGARVLIWVNKKKKICQINPPVLNSLLELPTKTPKEVDST